MYCTACGQEIPSTARFCAQCGVAVPGAAAAYEGAPKRLFRLKMDAKIAGVCAGLAKYGNVDVTLVSIAAVAATLMTGVAPGTLAYVFAWIIMPVEEWTPKPSIVMPSPESTRA